MLTLRYSEPTLAPSYMTAHSAAADLKAREDIVVPAGKVAKVPTGVWIERVEWDKVPTNVIPELQVRARSSLSLKKSICLANGVGTVDADYPDEICVLLHNFGDEDFKIAKGDRIAQLGLNFLQRLPELSVGGERQGGFGSTGR